jgi:hypothetical protein
LGVESEPYASNWSVVKVLDGFAVERKIRAAGWNFFFIASEVKAIFLGAPEATKIQRAVNRILGKTNQQHFNGLEVTGIARKRFLGLPYVVVSAHPRHVQRNCYLDDAEARRSLMPGQNRITPSRILRQSSGEKGVPLPAVAD